MLKQLLLILFFGVVCSAAVSAQDLRVSQFDFATSVDEQNRQPVDIDTVFSSNVGTVFCFTTIEGIQDSAQIVHVWYYEDQQKARIELDIKSDKWRTWSSKKIVENWTGKWRVMIEAPDGTILETRTFIIRD